MADTLTFPITLPREFVTLLGAPAQAAATAREYILLGLYLEGRISGGKAAELLGLTRRGFISLLARNRSTTSTSCLMNGLKKWLLSIPGARNVTNVVSNTGPLIALAQIGQFDLLCGLIGKIALPSAVRVEVQDEASLTALTAADWITVQPVRDSLAAQLLGDELDPGESAAIILAKEIGAELVLLDDRGRKRSTTAGRAKKPF